MARGRTPGRAAGQITAQVVGTLLEEGAHVVKRAGAVAAPWIAWPIVLALGVFQWLLWRGPGSASIVAAAGLALAAMDVYLTRNRKTIVGRYAAAATTLAVAAWIAWVALVGLGLHGPLQAWAMGGFILCLAWSKWLTIRPDSETHGSVADLFGKHAIRSGQPRLKVSSTQTAERSVSGDLKLPPGTVASDLAKVPRYLEGAAGLPPGALQITPHDEDGGKAKFSLSNPLLIRSPQPWPGPSAPGASIAEPIVPSIYQDGTPLRYTVTNHHLKLAGMTGAGKALALDTPVPTPDGWAVMGTLRAGDRVFDETGQPCTVTDAWPVMNGRPCYRVHFSDGSEIIADAEHQWLTDNRASRLSESWQRHGEQWKPRKTARRNPQQHKRTRPAVRTTEQMAGSVKGRYGNSEYSVRVAAPLACPETSLPVPPYTLGIWLGDGDTRGGAITTADPEVVAGIEADGFEVRAYGRRLRYRAIGLSQMLTAAGLRTSTGPTGHGHNTMTGSKRIPSAYQRASEAQRRALLAGLLDSDGYCAKSGAVEFCGTSEALALDVLHLVSGLGYKAAIRSKPARLYGRDCGTAWTVAFTPADKVFRLPRKLARQVTATRATAGHRYITAIDPVASVPVRCIAVDSPSHLFLAGQACIPTHNSRGWGWCEVAETVTRRDAGVLAIDLTKGRQTVGPLMPALHRCETTAGGAITLLDSVHRMIRPRTDWLADKGLGEWREGCGLTHWTVLVEEAPDVFEELDNSDLLEQWLKDVKAARSAGIRWLISLQRPDWTQMPTLARGQMASCCFGLGQDSDDKFGLSAYQFDHCEPRPSIWADTYPGMHYLDHGQIKTDRKAMPLRTWYWGDTNDLMIAHCERYTAASRPMDGLSADMLGPIRIPNPKPAAPPQPQARPSTTLAAPAADDDDAALVLSDPAANLTAMMAAVQGHGLHAVDDDTEPAEGEIVDTNVTMSQADALNLPIDPAAGPRITFREPAAPLSRLTPEQADRALREQVNAWLSDGKTNFTVMDAVEVLEVTARSRSWLYDRVAVLEGEGVLRKAGFGSGWTIHQPANVEAA